MPTLSQALRNRDQKNDALLEFLEFIDLTKLMRGRASQCFNMEAVKAQIQAAIAAQTGK
jgi:hypothetical protein